MSTLESADIKRHSAGLVAIKAEGNSPGVESVSYALADLLVADASQGALRRFLEIALRLCNAGSAGLSLLRVNAAGQAIIRWEAVSGALASHEGVESPRDVSPCGQCLETATTTILSEPERAFPSLGVASPSISEDLIVPLFDGIKNPLGTLWIAHHDSSLRFGADDVHIAEQLGMLLVRALRMFDKDRGCQQPGTMLESHDLEKRAAAHDLSQERSRRERAEASESRIRQALAFKNAEIQDAHHRVKNTIQIAANFLQLQARKTPSAQASAALQEGYCRLHLLADVHELLYKGSDEGRQIPMRDLLETVTVTLGQSFCQESALVQLRTAIEPIVLAADQAIPLASLANEAITNAYKHAFPDSRGGEIALSLHRTEEEALVLQISDNGIGLASRPATDKDLDSLGLKLIHAFAAQLGGTLAFATPADSSGTSITLTIPSCAWSGKAAQSREPAAFSA